MGSSTEKIVGVPVLHIKRESADGLVEELLVME